MASNIKGITIEIGGNTTKLDSALKSVDSKTRSLSQELKQINTQLKFDPGNTVLLQQKFQVLSEKVSATRDKLKQLEEAQEQVERQFQNGEIDEGQYRAFQRELEKTKSQLNQLEGEAADAKNDIDRLGNEADQTGDEFKQMGTDAKTSAKDVGDGFNTTAINMSSVMNIVSQIGNVIQSAIQGAIRLGRKIGEIINEYLDTVDEINTNAAKYGISTELYQQWKYAEEVIDVSAETMGSSLGKLTRSLKQYQKGNEDTVQAFEDLGVAVYDSSGKFRDSEDIFYDTIDALGRVEDETQANIYANTLYGRSYQELEPLIQAGTKSLKDLGQEAKNRGAIMTQDELDKMQGAKDALDQVRAQLAVALAPLISAIAPQIEKIANWIADKLANPKVQEVLERIGEAFGKLLEGVLQMIDEAIESGEMEEFINWVIETLPDIVDGILNIISGIGDMIQGIKDLINWGKDAGKAIENWATNASKNILTMSTDTAKAFTGVETSGKNSFAATSGSWMKMINDNWTNFSTWGSNVKNFFISLPENISSFLSSIPSKFSSIFSGAYNAILDWGSSVKNWFLSLPGKIGEWLSGIGSAIANAFKNIKMPSPHFVGGNFNKWPPVLPSIKWYKEGGIFNSPSIIGVGEAGTEVVLPIDKLSQVLGSIGYGGGVVVNAPIQVVKELNDAEINRVGGRLSDIVGRQFAKRTGGVL